ncbi:class I SAM-dependent methyltransferase [Demequina rhizosphaerae]|uniref:class I SAM-dependent methyltransferase n=1 Tax=Demequina rhizosphaerae TaxID=1638985 RepID=UPI000783B5C9|nr:class I SAM-dependent methyltransferase [Demequina rhizosphaerae]
MITKTDLDWWRNLVPELDWVFATTYAQGAPHEYVIPDKTTGFTKDDCIRAARVIRTFGEPMKFYKATNLYLTLDDGWKYFPLDKDVQNTGIINRGRADHVYGVQNHPCTASGIASPYDAYASHWDSDHGLRGAEKIATVSLIREVFGPKLRRTLDVGCGTGLPLDLGLVESVRYVGIDPSSAMLNELVWKHPHLAGVYPMTYAVAEHQRVLCGTQFDTVLALGGSASYLTPDELERLRRRAKRAVLLMHYAPGEVPVTRDLVSADASLEAARSLGEQTRIGRFIATVVPA